MNRLRLLKPFCLELAQVNNSYALDNSLWNQLDEILPILEVASIKMLVFQKNNLTLSDVYGHILDFKLQLSEQSQSTLASSIIECIDDRMKKILDNVLMKSCVYLDPRFQINMAQADKQEAIDHLVCLYRRFRKFNPIDSQNETIPAANQNVEELSRLEKYLMEKHPLTEASTQIEDEQRIYDKLISFGRIGRVASDSKIEDFWNANKHIYPDLFVLSTILNAVPSTEISVERLFSHLKYILNRLRNNLNDDSLEQILILRMNQDLFDE